MNYIHPLQAHELSNSDKTSTNDTYSVSDKNATPGAGKKFDWNTMAIPYMGKDVNDTYAPVVTEQGVNNRGSGQSFDDLLGHMIGGGYDRNIHEIEIVDEYGRKKKLNMDAGRNALNNSLSINQLEKLSTPEERQRFIDETAKFFLQRYEKPLNGKHYPVKSYQKDGKNYFSINENFENDYKNGGTNKAGITRDAFDSMFSDKEFVDMFQKYYDSVPGLNKIAPINVRENPDAAKKLAKIIMYNAMNHSYSNAK